MINNEELSQGERNQLFKYDYYFNISFHEIKDDNIYYKLSFGKCLDDKNNITIKRYLIIRYSEIYNLNLYHEEFPPRTLFKYTSKKFINKRIQQFNKWFEYILTDKNKCKTLYNTLLNLSVKQYIN